MREVVVVVGKGKGKGKEGKKRKGREGRKTDRLEGEKEGGKERWNLEGFWKKGCGCDEMR